MNRLLALCFVWLAVAFLAACDDGEPSADAKRLPATIAGATVDRKMVTSGESADRIAWAIEAVKAQGWACRNIHFFHRTEAKHFRPAFRMNCDNYRHNYNFVKNANGRWAVGEYGEDTGYFIRGFTGLD